MATIFDQTNYRKLLRSQATRGLASRLAEAAQCQNSHISRVLKEDLHLTMDQAFRVSRFLGHSPSEEAYFLKLVEHDRSGDVAYRERLAQELSELRKTYEDLSRRIKEDKLSNAEHEMTYYSGWHWSAIHIATSIPSLQTPQAIARRLNLDETLVRQSLETLESFGLVKSKGATKITAGGIHLSKQSPMNAQQHSNWRARAVLDSQNPAHDGIHYTVVQSVSKSDYGKIKQLILKTIDDYTAIARPSKEEELVCLTMDFFKV